MLPERNSTSPSSAMGASETNGATVSPTSQFSDLSARDLMTRRITRLMATLALCDSDFPRARELPQVASVPANNLGHYVLLNYRELAGILWSAAADISTEVEARRKSAQTRAITIGFVAGTLALIAAVAAQLPIPAALILMVVVGLLAGSFTRSIVLDDPTELVADVRAKTIREVLDGKAPAAAVPIMSKVWSEWGDGDFTAGKAPLLIAYNEAQDFPGFGRVQARKIFVCRRGKSDDCLTISSERLNERLSEALVDNLQQTRLEHVSFGHVVVLDGRSLTKRSPWLNAQGRPNLYVDNSQLAAVESLDPDASARVYAAVQALLPQHLTCVAIFTRAFRAGSSAACEVCVTTLGPPYRDEGYVLDRLRRYEQEKLGANSFASPLGQLAATSVQECFSGLEVRMELSGNAYSNYDPPFRGPAPDISNRPFEPFLPGVAHKLENMAEELSKASDRWIGPICRVDNWREENSVTVTPDRFGRTESLAATHVLYDEVCRTALDTLEKIGFDVSEHRDAEGKYMINAEKIEQMVVGERVFMSPDQKAADNKSAARTDAATQGASA
jgi:hypothetical protein